MIKQFFAALCIFVFATISSYSQTSSGYNASSVNEYRSSHKLQYGRLRISNEHPNSVKVSLYHPDYPDVLFATVSFGSNSVSNFMYNNEAITIASDWGISFSDDASTSPIYFVGDKAQYYAGTGFVVKEFSGMEGKTTPDPTPTVSAGSVSPTISDQPGLTQQQFLDFKKAKQLMSNGDYAEAARLLEKVKNPDYPNAFLENMLIQCYTKIGDYVAAAEEQKILAKVGKYAGKIATASIQQTSKANNRIMETDSVAYAAARKTNTIEAYQNYLNSKYHSRYAKSARTMIDYLNYENAQRENTESSYTKYLNNFPNGEYASDAKNDINRLVKTSNDYYWNQYYNARYARNYSIRRMVITETIGLGALAVGVNATVNGDPNSDLQVITQILGFVIGGGAVIGGFAGIGYINDQSSLMERSKNKIRPLPYSVSFRASPSLYCYRNHYTPALSLTIGF